MRRKAPVKYCPPSSVLRDLNMAYELIAAVDLGSNSFRLQVGRIVANQIYPLDGLKESVRLAGG